MERKYNTVNKVKLQYLPLKCSVVEVSIWVNVLHSTTVYNQGQHTVMLLQVYNPRIRTNSVIIQPISTDQAKSRKQLAGPTGEKLNFY